MYRNKGNRSTPTHTNASMRAAQALRIAKRALHYERDDVNIEWDWTTWGIQDDPQMIQLVEQLMTVHAGTADTMSSE